MKKRKLGNSSIHVTELGLGCMSIGTDEKTAQEIIHAALEEGINYFDTADLYDHGLNEEILGRTLKDVREEVVIATKAGNRWNQEGNGWSWDPSKSYIKEAVKNSLKRMGTDYIDLYQLHGGTMEDTITETIEAFEELKAEGYIRSYGISSIRPNVIREYMNKSSIDSVMMQYSILDRRPEEESLPLLHQHGISVVTRGPLAKGLLSNRALEKASAAMKDKGYLDYSWAELTQLLQLMKEKFAASRSMTEIALQYNLANPAVTAVVAGASSPAQLKENAQAVKRPPLSSEEVSFIKEIAKLTVYQQHRA
jgi:aryl-alcohol dehydrogenase-like predicted oxidoreductase